MTQKTEYTPIKLWCCKHKQITKALVKPYELVKCKCCIEEEIDKMFAKMKKVEKRK